MARYSYLDDADDDDEVPHPDIAADFGDEYCGEGGIDRLLARIIALTTATGTQDSAAGPTHWSTGPSQRRGKLIHHHPAGPNVPPPHCCRNGKCKDHFPKPPAEKSHIGDDGRIQYRRRPCDVMVVAYNPWISLYYTAHINVEVVCSSLHVISYLFKCATQSDLLHPPHLTQYAITPALPQSPTQPATRYSRYIMKGPDRNRIQLVVDGEARRGERGAADSSTHRRSEKPDEIAQWRNATETCAPHAYRRHASLTTGIQWPAVQKLVVHEQRQRNVVRFGAQPDEGLSSWEVYLARPLLSDNVGQEAVNALAARGEADLSALRDLSAHNFTMDIFYSQWISGSEKTAPKASSRPLAPALAALDIVAYESTSGRLVYRGTSPTALRTGGTTEIAPRLYWRRARGDVKVPSPPLRTCLHCTAPLSLLPAPRRSQVTRLARVPHSGGQIYYLRLLATKIGARTYDDLLTYEGVVQESYENACRERGLLSEDSEARKVLEEAVAAGDDVGVMRSLFVQLTREGYPLGSVIDDPAIWHAIVGADAAADPDAQERCIADLDERLKMLGGSMRKSFAQRFWPSNDQNNEVERELRHYSDKGAQRAICDGLLLDGLPGEPEQADVVMWGLTGETPERQRARRAATPPPLHATPDLHVASATFVAPASVEVAFLQGDGGSGKSRTLKRLVAELRARGQIAMVCAASNLAATNFERGMSFHALSMLAIDSDENGNTTIKLKPGGTLTRERLALFRATALIVIDEGPSLNKCVIEALINCVIEHSCKVRLLIVGDVQQIPPIYGNSREETVEASIVSSANFHDWAQLRLTKQYRAASDPEWGDQNRLLGNGTANMLPNHDFNDAAGGKRAVAMPLVTNLFTRGQEEQAHPRHTPPPTAQRPTSAPPLTHHRLSPT